MLSCLRAFEPSRLRAFLHFFCSNFFIIFAASFECFKRDKLKTKKL
jgi:hypothetical protein